ncbi:MAG TPA: hypothetical protein OIM43_08750 [Prevotellaceae bacterium]|nr:hypothetical protein [Prevotellaceae bacterium]
MKIERIITEGELLNVEQLAEIAGGTGVQGNNTNGGVCKCTGDGNSNGFLCTCEGEIDDKNEPKPDKPIVNPGSGDGK